MGAFNLEKCVRSNILQLEPYRCARDDYKDDGTNVLLDANENAFGPSLNLTANGGLHQPNGSAMNVSQDSSVDLLGLNRYPDPHQIELKQLFCNLRNSGAHSSTSLTPENLFVGVGSDEAIDAILRTFCVPGRDRILTCPPTYGMYSVSACVNDVAITKVPLQMTGPNDEFQLQPQAINEALSADPSIKVVYICSPGNPTGDIVRKEDVRAVLEHPTWNGVVVVDEAYIDFADDPATQSLATWVPEWKNLIVMQTLSKAFGMAGVRVGVAFADPKVARIFNSLKAPYNISSPSSALAIRTLQKEGLAVMEKHRAQILEERRRLVAELPKIAGVGRIRGGKDANFILVEMLDLATKSPSNEVALAMYERLAEKKNVVVRFRGKEAGCLGCLRITVGTEDEMSKFLTNAATVLQDIATERKVGSVTKASQVQEDMQEKKASEVVA